MAFARAMVRRIRGGVRRRVDRVLDRFGLGNELQAAAALAEAREEVDRGATDTVGPPLTLEQVEVLFEEMVRPALQSDGGDITLVKVESNDVYVELTGACQTCPSSIVTMQMGIQRLLEEEFPQFGRLIRVNG